MDMIGYVAGILDGEGSFMTATSGFTPKVQVHITDLDVLETLQTVTGCGTIHKVTKRQDHWKQAWVWRCSGNEAVSVMNSVLPYMSKHRSNKIHEVLEIWYNRCKNVRSTRDVVLEAAEAYRNGDGSFRSLAVKYGVSRTAIWREIKGLNTGDNRYLLQ